MNKIVDKFLKKGHKFMPKMHLRQPGFTYSACGQFTKNKQRMNSKVYRDRRYKIHLQK